ncbi:hypothetical protein MTO96_009156 [Rhipicephalus appendiculatus]
MDDSIQPIADAEQTLGDSEVEIHVEAIEDPSDAEESQGTGIAALRLGSACNAVATAFFTVLSAAVVTGLVFVFVLKPSSAPIAVPSGDLKGGARIWDRRSRRPGRHAGNSGGPCRHSGATRLVTMALG